MKLKYNILCLSLAMCFNMFLIEKAEKVRNVVTPLQDRHDPPRGGAPHVEDL